MNKPTATGIKADYIGIIGSVLCIIQCAATPMLLLTTTWLRHEVVRTSFLHLDYAFIALNALAVFATTRRITIPAVRGLLWGALALLIGCLLLEEVNPLFEYGMYLASAGLIGGHVASIRHNLSCQHHPENTATQ